MIQQLGFGTQKLHANVDYCYVWRRSECASLGPELEHLSLRSDSSLAAKRRADALHAAFFFFKQKTAYEIMPSLVGSEMCIRDRRSAGRSSIRLALLSEI